MRPPLSKRHQSVPLLFASQRLLAPQLRSSHGHWLSWLLLGTSLSAASALVAALSLEIVDWPIPRLTSPQPLATIFEANFHFRWADELKPSEADPSPHLTFQNPRGATAQPLPLGIVLANGSGGEILVFSDLPEGTKLSAGTPLGPTRWSMPARDLEKAFIAAPENFSGSMQVTAKLYSSDNIALETKNIRFEWTAPHPEDSANPVNQTKAATLEIRDLAADEKGAIRNSKGSEPVSAYRADTPMTGGGSSGSSARAWSPLWLTSIADWTSQISPFVSASVEQPGQRRLAQPPTSPPSSSATWLERGERLLRAGSVVAARPLLRRAADAGKADAAVDLAMSYDPSFVPYGNPGSALADPAEAVRWYKRALKLGRKEVAGDIERLTNMAKNASP